MRWIMSIRRAICTTILHNDFFDGDFNPVIKDFGKSTKIGTQGWRKNFNKEEKGPIHNDIPISLQRLSGVVLKASQVTFTPLESSLILYFLSPELMLMTSVHGY